MRIIKKTWMLFMLLALAVLLAPATTQAKKVKTSKVAMNLTGNKIQYKYPEALNKAKKVTVKSSKKTVVKAKYKKMAGIRRIIFTAKKAGTATVTVKCKLNNKKISTYKYKVKVASDKKKNTDKGNKKEATAALNYDPDEDEHEDYVPGNNTVEPTPYPEPTAPSVSEPTVEPTPVPTPKYEYKVEVLNEEETLYNSDDQMVILHMITDNPNPDTFTLKSNIPDDFEYRQYGFYWGDIHYNVEDGDLPGGWRNSVEAVEDGYVCLVSFKTAGEKKLTVYEGVEHPIRYSDTYTYIDYDYIIKTDDVCNLSVSDYEQGKEEYLSSVMDEIFTEDMTDYEKIRAFSNYLVKNFHYTSYTEKGELLLREWADVWWRSGVMECGTATNIVGKMADRLGLKWESVHMTGLYETENRGQIFGASGHVCNKIYIDGEAYLFDGCPNGLSAKEYAEDEIDYII